MIRVDLGSEVRPGIFEYRIPAHGIAGKSSQPLLDACRQIQSIVGDPCREEAGLYREGKDQPDLACPVHVGARFRLAEDIKGGPRFRKFESFDASIFKIEQQQHPETPHRAGQ
jgi:hypothetical protein